MIDNLFPVLSFVLITTFTPGPNNISSASMGVLHGYKNTLRYLAGITVGFFGIMLLTGWISASLLIFFPTIESTLRFIGAAYILYLAFGILKASYSFNQDSENNLKPMGFVKGLLLQIMNPKAIVYGLTLFSVFLAPITHNMAAVILAAILLAITAFCAISTWAMFGAAIKTYLRQPRVKTFINIILSLFLVYTAVELVGIL